MGSILKVLGQQMPPDTNPVTLYTVPPSTSTVVSSFVVCNQAGTASTFRIAISAAGGSLATPDYIFYDCPINANDTVSISSGITMQTGAVVRCRSGNGLISFSMFGQENS